MKNDISPQYILFQTIKALINKLHDVVRDLNESHEQLEKKMEHRTKRISNYISENEIKRKEIIGDIEEICEKLNIKKTQYFEYLKRIKKVITEQN